jgi:hypothetical protein
MTASRARWAQLPQQPFAEVAASGCTYELPRRDWPLWAQRTSQVQRVLIYSLGPGEAQPSVCTTATVVARLLSERYDPKDEAPYNYNWYFVVRSSDGQLYQSGPSRDVDFGHHLRDPVASAMLQVRREP